jgi:hypothetical protein
MKAKKAANWIAAVRLNGFLSGTAPLPGSSSRKAAPCR